LCSLKETTSKRKIVISKCLAGGKTMKSDVLDEEGDGSNGEGDTSSSTKENNCQRSYAVSSAIYFVLFPLFYLK
jgi:hypothetical protein